MKGVMEGYGIVLPPLSLSVWAIPARSRRSRSTGRRLWLFDRRLAARGAHMIGSGFVYAVAGRDLPGVRRA